MSVGVDTLHLLTPTNYERETMTKHYEFIIEELQKIAGLKSSVRNNSLWVELSTYTVCVDFDGSDYSATGYVFGQYDEGALDEAELFNYRNPVAVAHKIIRLWDKDLSHAY
jgi:hypothetical protein